jgi:hypothetical protein
MMGTFPGLKAETQAEEGGFEQKDAKVAKV